MSNNKIKKIFFLVFGLIIVFAFSAFLVNKNMKDPKLTGPAIKFNEEKHDFGDVPEGPQIETFFEFTNLGEDTLKIKNVTTSCGCTGAMMDEKRTFSANEKGKIRVTFNTQGRNGKNDKTITVESNDPKYSIKTLTISCNIVKQ